MRKAVRAIVIQDGKLLVMKRNKFGQEYYTLPGGGIDFGETAEQALLREMAEETSLHIRNPRLVYVEEAGHMYGTQYIYECEYTGGEPALAADSEEAKIHKLGQNLYQPMWLAISELATVPFVSEQLKAAILKAVIEGFPAKPVDISPSN